jgi:hypothetical protein
MARLIVGWETSEVFADLSLNAIAAHIRQGNYY